MTAGIKNTCPRYNWGNSVFQMEGDLYAYHNEPKWRRRHITARWLSILFATWSQTNHHSLLCLPRIEISGLPPPNSWRTNYFVCSIIASPCLTLTSSSLERSSTHCILTITLTEIKSHQISLRYKKIRNQHAVYSACLLSPTVYILNLFMHGCMRCSWLLIGIQFLVHHWLCQTIQRFLKSRRKTIHFWRVKAWIDRVKHVLWYWFLDCSESRQHRQLHSSVCVWDGRKDPICS